MKKYINIASIDYPWLDEDENEHLTRFEVELICIPGKYTGCIENSYENDYEAKILDFDFDKPTDEIEEEFLEWLYDQNWNDL